MTTEKTGRNNGVAVTRFGLIRHARTIWNEEKRIQGRKNSPLSAVGVAMAKRWGQELGHHRWDRILMSDLGRVQETAEQVNASLQLPLTLEPRLREQDWGQWSGQTFPDLFSYCADEIRDQEQLGWMFQPPGGESRMAVLERSRQALLEAHARWPGENILVICHEGNIKCLLYFLLKRKFLPDEPRLLTGYQLHLLQVAGGKLLLEEANALPLWTP